MLSWSLSEPYHRLVLLRELLRVMVGVIAAFLQLSGEKWTRRQEALAAKTGKRSYRVLEAARGTIVLGALLRILEMLHGVPPALLTAATSLLRSLRFRLLSACMCCLHRYLRVVRQGAPYCLFLVLDGNTDTITSLPTCMWPTLSVAVTSFCFFRLRSVLVGVMVWEAHWSVAVACFCFFRFRSA